MTAFMLILATLIVGSIYDTVTFLITPADAI